MCDMIRKSMFLPDSHTSNFDESPVLNCNYTVSNGRQIPNNFCNNINFEGTEGVTDTSTRFDVTANATSTTRSTGKDCWVGTDNAGVLVDSVTTSSGDNVTAGHVSAIEMDVSIVGDVTTTRLSVGI